MRGKVKLQPEYKKDHTDQKVSAENDQPAYKQRNPFILPACGFFRCCTSSFTSFLQIFVFKRIDGIVLFYLAH